MKIDSERARVIEAYISKGGDVEVGKWPIEISGEKEILPFYKLPWEILRYNSNNGRLAIERRKWELDNHRKLDTTLSEDAATVRTMLQALDADRTSLLKADLHLKGQMEPGVITFDGVVINGNRRMAVLEALHQEEPTGKWQFIEVIRLPQDTSEANLWKIEAGLQLSKDKVAEYHPVNELLKIKEGIDRGLTPSEVAAAMYGWQAEEIEQALARLDIIDNFLEFFGQPQNYEVIKRFGLHEHFIDIQKRIIAPAKKLGVPNRELTRRLKNTFALLRAHIGLQGKGERKGITHWDIRKLDAVFSDPHAKDTFLKALGAATEIKKVPYDVVVDDFRDSLDVLAMREARSKPLKLIEKAISAVESIDPDSLSDADPALSGMLQSALGRLSELIKGISARLGT